MITGFAARGRVVMQQMALGRLIEFLIQKLQLCAGLIDFFVNNQGLEFLDALFKVGFDIQIMQPALFVLTQFFDGVSSLRQFDAPSNRLEVFGVSILKRKTLHLRPD